MDHPKRKNKVPDGKVNSYILNKMIYADTKFMDEYILRPLINKRFGCHLRANEIRKYHLDPLCDRHWLKKVEIPAANGYSVVMYRRYASFRHVKPEETLRDQFANIYFEYPDSNGIEDTYTKFQYMEHLDDEAWSEPDFIGTFTEKDYEEYCQREEERYQEYLKHIEESEKPPSKKMDPDFLDHLLD